MRNLAINLHYLRNAFLARWHYRKQYDRSSRPCLRCMWEHEPEDKETPWHWIYCDKCDWGNE